MSHKDLLKQCVKLFQMHSLSDIFDVDYTCGEEYIVINKKGNYHLIRHTPKIT